MGGEGSGRKPDMTKRALQTFAPVVYIPPSDPVFIPNTSGDLSPANVQNAPVKPTDVANKAYVDSVVVAGSSNYWLSGGNAVWPVSDKWISGGRLVLSKALSGANAKFNLTDDTESAFNITQGNNNYMCVNTTNGSEAIRFGCLAAVPILEITPNEINITKTLSGAGIVANKVLSGGYVYSPNIESISGATIRNEDYCDYLSGAINSVSGATIALSGSMVIMNSDLLAVSGATLGNTAYCDYLSGSILSNSGATLLLSGACNVLRSDVNAVSGATIALSGSMVILRSDVNAVSGATIALSGAQVAHRADSSDPHGVTLSQTNLYTGGTFSGASAVISGGIILEDKLVSGSAYIANILYGTNETPPTASGYPIGSIYLQYTA